MDDEKRQEFVRLRAEYAIQLRQEREALAAEVAEGAADLRPLESERANELEERAQQADATRMFIHLDERRKLRIDEIDQVLQRLALGTYGLCDRCGEPIPVARLRALPTARVHVQCADDEERGSPVGLAEEVPLPAGEVDMLMTAEWEGEAPGGQEAEERVERMPPDISSLSDEEVEEYLRERLEEDGRVDRLVIDELLWEREERTGRPQDEEPSSGTLSGAMEELIESDQEDQDYEPPDKPVREET